MLAEMTLKARRILLNILLVPALAGTAIVALAWISRSKGVFAIDYPVPALTERWWSLWRPAEESDLLWAMGGLAFHTFIPLIAELFLRRLFGRNPSPEIFFLRFFLLTLPIQAVRIAIPLVPMGIIDASWAITASRISWFARLLGIVSLVNIGLYTGELPFRRSGAILGSGALAVLAISVMIPLDVTQVLGNLILRAGASTSLSLICVTMEALAILSLIGSAMVQNNHRYFLLGIALLLVIAGADMAFFISRPLLVPGAALTIVGIAAFAREIRKIYQWL